MIEETKSDLLDDEDHVSNELDSDLLLHCTPVP
jgi:hypothetical protein